MNRSQQTPTDRWDTESIWKILWRMTPPVMAAQLIQAMYNIVDSFFIGQYDGDGLTALAVIFPLQLIFIALASGTGVGVNTLMARQYAQGNPHAARETAGIGTLLACITWIIFGTLSVLCMEPYVRSSASAPGAISYAVIYGNIISIGSIGTFLESIWSKALQAGGHMALPMVAQIAGALVNIVFDPVLIFGWGPIPAMGVAGAAIATVLGQLLSAVIVGIGIFSSGKTGVRGCAFPVGSKHFFITFRQTSGTIYRLGYPSIFMQMLYTVYISALNIILAQFSDAAVTVLGLYYKLQSFFFIPLFALQTCVVPILSYNFTRSCYRRCHRIMLCSFTIAGGLMLIGTFCFEGIPGSLIGIFSADPLVHTIGIPAFRIIGLSFIPIVFSLLFPVFFQAIGQGLASSMLSLTRQIFCLVTLFYLFSKIGLGYTWLAFPLSEIITSAIGTFLYVRQLRRWKNISSPDTSSSC